MRWDMASRSRWDQAASLTLSAVGFSLLVVSLPTLARLLPDLLGAEGEHMAGDATLFVLIVVVPLAFAGLITLLVARLVWRGSRNGVALGLLWVGLAWLACAAATAGSGNLLSFARAMVLESGSWSLSWPELGVTGSDGATYYGSLDDPTFWIPGIVAVGALAVACFLLGALLRDERGPR